MHIRKKWVSNLRSKNQALKQAVMCHQSFIDSGGTITLAP